MTGLPAPPSRPRSPWQLLYGAAHAVRWRYWARRARRLPRPVVSVGNLHWGGTGKTPMVAAVATHLRDRGMVTAILSRGYRSQGKGVRLVSVGDGPLLGPLVAGDEPVLLAGELPGIAVVVSRDRYLAGRHALERLPRRPDVFVLDDGFSHLRLFRDVDLLVFPADDPFAGGRLPPLGRLREPLRSTSRADAVVATGAGGPVGNRLAAALRPFGFTGPGFASRTRVLSPRLEGGRLLATGARVVAVAAIARPQRFLDAARRHGLEPLAVLTFPDHHDYPERSVARIVDVCRAQGAEALLTTSKDRVKLSGRLEVPLAELPIRAEPEQPFWEWLDRQLDQQMATLGPFAP